MTTQTWYDQEPRRPVYFRQRNICEYGNLQLTSSEVQVKDNWVKSWRGPIENIRVGSKKRRKFRYFELRKYELLGGQSNVVVCFQPNMALAGNDLNPARLANTHYWMNDFDPPMYPTAWAGSTMPVYKVAEHRALGEEYRDELEFDLFVKAKEPRFDSAVFLAELGETLVSIQAIFKGTLLAFRKAGHVKKTTRHIILNAEELWLWYRYFLLPAMLDAEEMLEAIKPQATIDRIQTGMSKKKFTKKGTIYAHGWWSVHTWEIPWTQELVISGGGALDITKRLDPSEWGTSAVDLLRAGWEVIPFSFIFDWFVNLGDYLQTLREIELEIAQSYVTYAIESNLTLENGPGVTQVTPAGLPMKPVIRQVLVERKIDLEPPNHPQVNAEWMNVLRTVDSIALLCGVIKNVMKFRRGKK